jgi:hypothetical protein
MRQRKHVNNTHNIVLELEYSEPPNTGPCYQMVQFSDARFYNICPDFSLASLDRFIHKEIFYFV